ncbi:hypothetical protein Pan216_40120 [Planctomycetes bacterium Pan216]|uniref:Uncharacterized protein n=1 Tax=Kolteria novifilia TaxID=2527975 RepID=A0A518B833_9BACT|nr:hypothetical protein Pan216_40120 [Planctomycetes bacterium Pan216]
MVFSAIFYCLVFAFVGAILEKVLDEKPKSKAKSRRRFLSSYVLVGGLFGLGAGFLKGWSKEMRERQETDEGP